MNDRRDDMKLPEGKTCGDCKWLERCRMLFQQSADSTECDWNPHRFNDGSPMNPETIEALRKAYAALARLPNWAKQSVQAGSTMAEIRHLLEREGVEP